MTIPARRKTPRFFPASALALSCALLPGIAVAVLLFGLTRWSLLTGAVVAALLVGLGSLFVSRTSRQIGRAHV